MASYKNNAVALEKKLSICLLTYFLSFQWNRNQNINVGNGSNKS